MAEVTHLVKTIRPAQYRFVVEPDLIKFTFKIQESIKFQLLKASPKLVFHANDLVISRPVLTSSKERINPKRVSFQRPDQTVTFEFDKPLPAGSYTLDLETSGQLSDKLHGFYLSRYELNGQTKYLATTQFEATHAREAIVCIDEPAAKAIFEVTIVTPGELTALSNGELLKTTDQDGLTHHHFEATPKMSTYLLAFVVGELEFAESVTNEGVRVRVYTTPGKIDQTEFALNTAKRALSFYHSYFGIPYPLPKLDMVAIPDFAAGAMENWGLVTYRETALLVHDNHSALVNKQVVSLVVCHELAHMWFGNLVTMAWWNDLWLNEGFASWVEYLAVDQLFPEWQMWSQFVADEYSRAQSLDSLANTHPIEVAVDDPKHLDEIFDAVSYSKGASVIRMLQQYLGADDFQTGLSHYLRAHSFANSTTDDLWSALEKASGKPVKKVMTAWTGQAGHPIVSFEKNEDELKLSQARFFASPSEAKRQKDQTLWPIPIQAVSKNGESESFLLAAAHDSWKIGPTSGWLKLNPNQAGFYRVQYTSQELADLIGAIRSQELGETDRLGLISDMTDLTKAGYESSDLLLEALTSFSDEHTYLVWLGIVDSLTSLLAIVEDPLRDGLEKVAIWLVEPTLTQLGLAAKTKESHFDQLLRPLLMGIAGRLGEPAVTENARKLFNSGKPVDPDLRNAIYTTVARHGSKIEYEELMRRIKQAHSQQEQIRLLRALSFFSQPALLQKTLDLALSDAVRPQDTISILSFVAGNRFGSDLTWEFVKKQWPELLKRYGKGGHMLEYIPTYVAGVFHDYDTAADVKQFFNKHKHPAINRPAKQAVERILLKADWQKRDYPKIESFVRNFKFKR